MNDQPNDFPSDIYTEPRDIDVDTLANLGPLRAMASGRGEKRGGFVLRDRVGEDVEAGLLADRRRGACACGKDHPGA